MSDAVMGLNYFSETEVKESVLSEKAASSPYYICITGAVWLRKILRRNEKSKQLSQWSVWHQTGMNIIN